MLELLLLTLLVGVVLKRPHIFEGTRYLPTGKENTGLVDGKEKKLPKRMVQTLEARQRERGPQTSDTPLPDEFPYRSILVENGIETVETLATVGDFTELNGIGDDRADQIRSAMTRTNLERKPQTGEEAES